MRRTPSLCPHVGTSCPRRRYARTSAVDTAPNGDVGMSRTYARRCDALTLAPQSRRGRCVRTLVCRLTCRRRRRRRRSASRV